MYINKQTQCLQDLHGVRSHRVCSNLYLTAQCEMRCNRFDEAAVSVDRSIQLMEETKADFGDDYNIVGCKFYNLKATL